MRSEYPLGARRDELLAFHARSAACRWLESTGRPNDAPACPIPEDVTSGALVREALAHDDRALAREFAIWYFRERLAEATRRWRTSQAATTARLDGQELSHAQLAALSRRTIGAEQDRATSALREVTVRLRQERGRWLEAHAAARADLGFHDHGSLVRALHPEVDAWTAAASGWLAETRAGYLAEWHHWRDTDHIASPRLADARLLASGVRPTDGAPSPVEAVRRTVEDWGFSAEVERIVVDTVERPGKVGFAFCSAVDPPGDVRISAAGGAAAGSYATLLHEFGHALHFSAGVDSAVTLWAASPALSEAFGFALELVVREPEWQQRHLGGRFAADQIARIRFARESVRRTVAASLCFEMAMHDGSPDPEGDYAKIFSREFGVAVDGASAFDRYQTYLEGQPCYPLLYVQAFTIRERIWARLGRIGGPRWFLDRSARNALEDVFPLLNQTTPDDWLSAVELPAPVRPVPR